MKKCIHCGTELPEGAKFCFKCGGKQLEQEIKEEKDNFQTPAQEEEGEETTVFIEEAPKRRLMRKLRRSRLKKTWKRRLMRKRPTRRNSLKRRKNKEIPARSFVLIAGPKMMQMQFFAFPVEKI